MKFWNFTKNAATETAPESAELRIDGDIVSDDDMWLYEWFDIKATAPNAFREELKQYKNLPLTVWIDSYGGDVFAAAGIYNALMDHKGKVTVKIDGKAMSAASIIAMAGEEVLISPVGIMMIHNPLTYAAGYASDLRKTADVLDKVKESIMNAYQIKTGNERDKISQMMDEETYMPAQDAVKYKFADKMMYADAKEPPKDVKNIAFSRNSVLNSAQASYDRFKAFQKTLPPEAENTEIEKAKLALQLEL